MGDPKYSNDSLEREQLNAAKAEISTQIAELSGVSGDDAYNLKSALEALLQSGATAGQLQASFAPLAARVSEIKATTGSSRTQAIAYVLSEETLDLEQRRLTDIQDALFDEQFQTDLRDAFERGGEDLVEAYDEATERTLERLAEIDAQLAEPGLSQAERQALLEAKQAALHAYTGDLEALLDKAQERGVEGIDELAAAVQQQREALEASALSPQHKEQKLAEASREAALVGAQFEGTASSIVMADAANSKTDRLLNGQDDPIALSADAFASNDVTFDALGAFSPPTEKKATETTIQLG